ncbi:hypothetical protein V8E36_007513 [Tilletia maclaganii]
MQGRVSQQPRSSQAPSVSPSAEPASTSSTSAERQGTFVQQIATCLVSLLLQRHRCVGLSGHRRQPRPLADGQPRPFSGLLDNSLSSRAPLSSARDDDERTPLLRAVGRRSGTGSNDLLSSDREAAGLDQHNGWSERGEDGSGGLGPSSEPADGLDAQPETQQRRATIALLSPELLRKENFLIISSSGPYMPEELDRRSAHHGGGRLSNDLRGSGLDRRSAGSLTQQQQQSNQTIPATPGSVEPGAPGGPRDKNSTGHTSDGLDGSAHTGSKGCGGALMPSPLPALPPPSFFNARFSPKLEAESVVLSGPIVEGWPED